MAFSFFQLAAAVALWEVRGHRRAVGLALAEALRALGRPSGLALFSSLLFPRPVHDILVRPAQTREGDNPARPISKQAVRKRLARLEALHLFQQVGGGDGRQPFVVNRPRLHALAEAFAQLAQRYGGHEAAGTQQQPWSRLAMRRARPR